ncbi:MAG: 1-phosphofructokinase family hexose kinase [Eudoraea sp.]|nr:1-phosphofructokinase family hexose kinase [Eudoraea sp.]
MNNVFTLTVNPAVDKSTRVEGIKPTKKLRCQKPVYEAGGGGINVSRVLMELGIISKCLFMAGGPTGVHLRALLEDQGIAQLPISIREWTRENLAVTDTTNNQQYRFGMPGPEIDQAEWPLVLDMVEEQLSNGDYLIASGSLSPGMPEDFYAQLGKVVAAASARLVLDTSGEPLIQAAKNGAYLIKPNLGELATLCGVTTISSMNLETMAKKCMKMYPLEILIVSLGAKGAMMVPATEPVHMPAPTVHQQSTIGAGDSMVAGLVCGLVNNRSLKEILTYGVACGTAATMTSGTQLCLKKDADNLYEWMISEKF